MSQNNLSTKKRPLPACTVAVRVLDRRGQNSNTDFEICQVVDNLVQISKSVLRFPYVRHGGTFEEGGARVVSKYIMHGFLI